MCVIFDISKMGVTELVISYRYIRAFLRGCSVAMVTSCIGKKTLNCLIIIGNLYDTIIEATNEKL